MVCIDKISFQKPLYESSRKDCVLEDGFLQASDQESIAKSDEMKNRVLKYSVLAVNNEISLNKECAALQARVQDTDQKSDQYRGTTNCSSKSLRF